MKVVKTCILIHFFLIMMVLFLTIHEASTSNDKTSSSKFVKQFLGSKRGDKVEGLEQVKKYLSKYGYLDSSSTDGRRYQRSRLNTFTYDSNVFDHALKKGIEKFQLYFNLNVSGILDEDTLSIMVKPRCNFPDLVNGTPIKHGGVKLAVRNPLNSSYYAFLSRPKLTKFRLKWFMAANSRQGAMEPLTDAFNSWAYAQPKFRFTQTDKYSGSDVKIYFGAPGTQEIFPFEGTEYLAYTVDVDIHFRVDISWGDGSDNTIDIETIAVHEIGHVLGLAHTSVEDAIMYPNAYPGLIKRTLHADDIAGITALYR